MLKGFTRKFRPLEIMNEEGIQSVHRATLAALRETGVRFDSEWALAFFKKNGCLVDLDNHRVRFPEALVEECLRKAPSSYRLRARNHENDAVFGSNSLYFLSSCGMQSINLQTLEPQVPSKTDFIDLVRVLDALPNVHWHISYPYFGFRGVPGIMCIPEGDALRIRYSGKHFLTAHATDCDIFGIQMAQAVGAECTGPLSPAPPMAWYDEAVKSARRMVEADFPILILNGGTYGASAPATHPGALVTGNAEIISMLVLVQLLHPGHRISAANFTFPQNMKSGAPAFSEIGSSLVQAMFCQMWRTYGVPCASGAGAMPSSKSMDFQTGYEKGIAASIAALSGANAISLHGSVSSELTMHPVQAIMDDDIAGMVGRLIAGEQINDETLALELINEVGPMPGNYLSTAHTRQWWKKMEYIPRAADRLTYPEWINSGKKKALDNARQIMEEILASHKVDPPLTAGQEQAIEDILNEARSYYRKKGLITAAEWEAYKRVL